MYDPWRNLILRALRVPHDPAAPAGSTDSLRVFRAGRNYLRLRIAGWAVTQVFALAGIVFWTVFLVVVERSLRAEMAQPAAMDPAAALPQVVATPAEVARPDGAATRQEATTAGEVAIPGEESIPAEAAVPTSEEASPVAAKKPGRTRNKVERFADAMAKAGKEAELAAREMRAGRFRSWFEGYKRFGVEVARLLPAWAFPVIWVLKIGGILAYFVQLPLTYAVRRLDYEMRWYLVTDRSLRLREGVWTVQETTMSFANLQEVVLMQDPIQRLLGLADVQVKSAGGGGGGGHPRHGQAHGHDLHTGRFHAVDNAAEIRDLILARLKSFRDAGLGDPEDHAVAAVSAGAETEGEGAGAAAGHQISGNEVLAAAREAVAEAKALRAAVG